MQKIKDNINNEDVDLVLIAGDIFDNSYDAVDDIDKIIKSFRDINSKYGTYAVFGNHDVDERLFAGMSIGNNKKARRDKRMEEVLEKSNIEIIDDETVLLDDAFYLIGRKDYKKAGDCTNNRKNLNYLLDDVDKKKPIILLEHEPIYIDKISKSGVDIHLSGYTHGGQFFSMTLLTRNKWKNQYGYIKENNMHSIVTSGVGLYGPNIRTSSDSEICILNISFKE